MEITKIDLKPMQSRIFSGRSAYKVGTSSRDKNEKKKNSLMRKIIAKEEKQSFPTFVRPNLFSMILVRAQYYGHKSEDKNT